MIVSLIHFVRRSRLRCVQPEQLIGADRLRRRNYRIIEVVTAYWDLVLGTYAYNAWRDVLNCRVLGHMCPRNEDDGRERKQRRNSSRSRRIAVEDNRKAIRSVPGRCRFKQVLKLLSRNYD